MKIVLTAGFAMFSMFFGSGNLVFPLGAGFKTQGGFAYALIGWVITAVILPFAGVLGCVRVEGSRERYYANLGKYGAFAFNSLVLILVGPFGVIPRCILVSFGGFKLMYPELPLWVFSAAFVACLVALCWERNKLVEIIGVFLTPFKLGGIVFLIATGLRHAPELRQVALSAGECFDYGLKVGYHTMDLLVAPLIAVSVYEYLLEKSPDRRDKAAVLKAGVRASLLGGAILCAVYYGFMALGARYAHILVGLAPEQYLAAIARETLGAYALPIVSATLAASCLATATILTAMWTDFLKRDIFKRESKRNVYLVASMGLAFAMSLLGFKTIMVLLGSVLEWLYPLAIVYAVYKLFDKRPRELRS